MDTECFFLEKRKAKKLNCIQDNLPVFFHWYFSITYYRYKLMVFCKF